MKELINIKQFEFEGTSMEVADKLIAQCNRLDEMVEKARVLVSVQRGRGYSYALVKLGTKKAVAERYKVSDVSIGKYIEIFKNREKFITEDETAVLDGVPENAGTKKLLELAKVDEAKEALEAIGLDTTDHSDKDICKASNMEPEEAKAYLSATDEKPMDYKELYLAGAKALTTAEVTIAELTAELEEAKAVIETLKRGDTPIEDVATVPVEESAFTDAMDTSLINTARELAGSYSKLATAVGASVSGKTINRWFTSGAVPAKYADDMELIKDYCISKTSI